MTAVYIEVRDSMKKHGMKSQQKSVPFMRCNRGWMLVDVCNLEQGQMEG